MSTWLVAGSSESAVDWFDHALCDADVSITTNGGLFLWMADDHCPDWYFLSDNKACELFRRYVPRMRRMGMKLATPRRKECAMQARGVADADEFITMREAAEDPPRYDHERYVHSRFSGTICTQFALKHGADRIVWIGMDGYKSTPAHIQQETFDGRMGKQQGKHTTHNVIQPFYQSCIDQNPGVQFVMAGKPRYELSGHNFKLVA